MREFPAALNDALTRGATTLCHCLRLTRRDGTVIGLTDHDAALTVDGTAFSPAAGFEASQQSAALGPVTGEWDLGAALTDDRLGADALRAGLFDGASVEMLLVDWSNPDACAVLARGTLGQVSARDGRFHAEVRGPFAAYDQMRGRLFSARCDAELGDARCGVDLAAPQHRSPCTIERLVSPAVFTSLDVGSFPTGHFDGGLARFASGAPVRIRRHALVGATARMELWHAPAVPLAAGMALTVQVGCDKAFATCRDRFANAVNFRGFPHMPGDDFALSYPSASDGNLDGGSRS